MVRPSEHGVDDSTSTKSGDFLTNELQSALKYSLLSMVLTTKSVSRSVLNTVPLSYSQYIARACNVFGKWSGPFRECERRDGEQTGI